MFPLIHNPQPAVNDDSRVADNGHHHVSHRCLGLKQNKQSHQHHPHSSHPPTCIIILSSMRSGSVGIAGHLGPIPPWAAGKTPRDHLQLGTRQHLLLPRPQLASLLINCTSRLRLCCQWPPNPPSCQIARRPLSPLLRSDRYLPLRNSHFQLSLPRLFSDSIAIVSPWPHAISGAAVLEAVGG